MIARECDRCGSFYIPNDDMRTYIVSKKSLVGIQIDLCPECHDDLITFDEIRDFIGRDNANLIEHSEDPDFGHSYSRG